MEFQIIAGEPGLSNIRLDRQNWGQTAGGAYGTDYVALYSMLTRSDAHSGKIDAVANSTGKVPSYMKIHF